MEYTRRRNNRYQLTNDMCLISCLEFWKFSQSLTRVPITSSGRRLWVKWYSSNQNRISNDKRGEKKIIVGLIICYIDSVSCLLKMFEKFCSWKLIMVSVSQREEWHTLIDTICSFWRTLFSCNFLYKVESLIIVVSMHVCNSLLLRSHKPS